MTAIIAYAIYIQFNNKMSNLLRLNINYTHLSVHALKFTQRR